MMGESKTGGKEWKNEERREREKKGEDVKKIYIYIKEREEVWKGGD